jgi:hypothetical protein
MDGHGKSFYTNKVGAEPAFNWPTFCLSDFPKKRKNCCRRMHAQIRKIKSFTAPAMRLYLILQKLRPASGESFGGFAIKLCEWSGSHLVFACAEI